MSEANQEGHSEPIEAGPKGHDACGSDEAEALHDIEQAKADIGKAKDEIQHGMKDLDAAEQKLDAAEEELEEAHHHPKIIHFSVDAEPYETERREWTPNEIITEFSGLDITTHYLIETDPHHQANFQGKGTVPFELHDCASFQVISVGPAPVSDGNARTGVACFVAGLASLGYKPTIAPGKPEHVYFDYEVPAGKFAGQLVRLGIIVPQDFPLTAPGGIHVSPKFYPNQSGGVHPTGGIHDSADFQSAVGGDWQYWSRPYTGWSTAKKAVATYMSHVWKLWHTQ
ncbi:E2/UBC family protein [Bradyrhizobium sp. LB11.1]|uniref:E2/UBC family protein n=1 Tax=Bradyrhizobium sp. LB11.1 TaxID=3156326 RepID=UPI00339B1E20